MAGLGCGPRTDVPLVFGSSPSWSWLHWVRLLAGPAGSFGVAHVYRELLHARPLRCLSAGLGSRLVRVPPILQTQKPCFHEMLPEFRSPLCVNCASWRGASPELVIARHSTIKIGQKHEGGTSYFLAVMSLYLLCH